MIAKKVQAGMPQLRGKPAWSGVLPIPISDHSSLDVDVVRFPTGTPLISMLSITAMLPVEVDPLSSTMEMLWTWSVLLIGVGVAWLGSNRKRIQPVGAEDGGVVGLLVQPPTVCFPPSAVTTTNWSELVLHWTLARKSKPSSVRDMPVTFSMTAPAQVPAEAEALVARARPRLRGSVVLSGEAPRSSTQAAARVPDRGSDMYA